MTDMLLNPLLRVPMTHSFVAAHQPSALNSCIWPNESSLCASSSFSPLEVPSRGCKSGFNMALPLRFDDFLLNSLTSS